MCLFALPDAPEHLSINITNKESLWWFFITCQLQYQYLLCNSKCHNVIASDAIKLMRLAQLYTVSCKWHYVDQYPLSFLVCYVELCNVYVKMYVAVLSGIVSPCVRIRSPRFYFNCASQKHYAQINIRIFCHSRTLAKYTASLLSCRFRQRSDLHFNAVFLREAKLKVSCHDNVVWRCIMQWTFWGCYLQISHTNSIQPLQWHMSIVEDMVCVWQKWGLHLLCTLYTAYVHINTRTDLYPSR